jgi:hypothetical protein
LKDIDDEEEEVKEKICYNLDERRKRRKKYLSDHIFFIFQINGK